MRTNISLDSDRSDCYTANMKNPAYLVVVSNASKYVLESIEELMQDAAYKHLRVVILTANPRQNVAGFEQRLPLQVIACDFSDEGIRSAMQPFQDKIGAVVCRGEKHIQYLRKLIPHLPPDVPVATPEALEKATNKRLMRQAFLQHFPEITPQFVQVHDDTAATIEKVEAALAYPVIVKPANLASSMLIQACHTRAELQAALGSVFALIQDVYKKHDRHGAPQVLVEEYLEGDFYSIDAYATDPGTFYFCPPVGYVPAKQLGIDDFFLYKRFVPTSLTEQQTAEGNDTVAKAMTALGLTHSSAHVELVLTKNGWKIIEIGPRLGRFRHLMYKAAYGIDHSMNDLLIHLGKEPVIPKKLLRHCTAYSIYPYTEGTLETIINFDQIANDPATTFVRRFAQPGAPCVYAKNGGAALAEFVIASDDVQDFQRATKLAETVKAVVV